MRSLCLDFACIRAHFQLPFITVGFSAQFCRALARATRDIDRGNLSVRLYVTLPSRSIILVFFKTESALENFDGNILDRHVKWRRGTKNLQF